VKVKWWHVPRGLWLAVIIVGVLFAGPASPAAEAEADDVDYSELGDAYLKLGKLEEALKWYERGLALEPENPKLYVGKASALYELRRLEEAVDTFDRALELRPDDWISYLEKAGILAELGRYEEAVESFDRVIKLSADESGYPLCLAYEGKIEALKELGKLEEALETYDEALTRFPEDDGLARGKGEVLLELGRYEEAAQYNELSAVTLGLSGLTKKVGTTPMREAQVKVSPPGITGGKLVVKFTVAASGGVTACSVVSSTLGNAAVDQEVCDRIMTWRFPAIEVGGVDVLYPFLFLSAGAE
jgi:TonB family protein